LEFEITARPRDHLRLDNNIIKSYFAIGKKALSLCVRGHKML